MNARHRRRFSGAAVLAALLALIPAAAPATAAPADAGKIRIARAAEADFDRYTSSPSPQEQAFMRERFWRMRTYAPYFDSRTRWYSDAWTYKDLYAIYSDSELAREHPEWILKDTAGRKLYIPFDCGGGSCTQNAGDIGDPAFRRHWIDAVVAQARPYRGVFVDDVNMEPRVANGDGKHAMPLDPRTGRTMTEADWRRYIAEFTEEIRAALPGKEIVHNALWFAGHDDRFVQRELQAATHIELERGANDAGITDGGGRFGYDTFIEHIEWLHARGKSVILDSYAEGASRMEYEMATLLLVAAGNDAVGSGWRTAPDDWWKGYEVDLGTPRGDRYEWQGLLRRDFERGYVLVNPPRRARRSVDLPAPAHGPAGDARASVGLAGGEGAVLLGSAPAARKAATRTLVRPVPNPVRRMSRSRAESSRTARRRMRRAVLVRGQVRGARAGRVGVVVERRTRGRWVAVRRSRARVARNTRFRRLFRGLRRGRYRVHAAYLGSAQARGSAAARVFRLRR